MIETIAAIYLAAKSAWSRAWSWLNPSAPRRPVPRFGTPQEVSQYLMDHAVYTGDPGGGAVDFYTPPEVFQAAMEAGKVAAARLSIDCDDYAAYAFAALRQIPGCSPQMYTLIDAGLVGSHVICAFYGPGALVGAIDTNGFHTLPDLLPNTLCKAWTAIYAREGYRYIDAVPTPFPF